MLKTDETESSTVQRALTPLTLWDSTEPPPTDAGIVYRWNGHADKGSTRSLLCYAEEHGQRLRQKYLAWVHDVGESRVAGKRLIDHLAIEDGLSYWWLTTFVEKSPYKSPITDAIRLLALEEIIVQQRPGGLRLVSANRSLSDALSGLCQRLGIEYDWERRRPKPSGQRHQSRNHRSPRPLQALRSLARHLRVALPFRHGGTSGWFAGDQAVFFCDYFVNVVPEEAYRGRFRSRYWEGLHDLLRRLGRSGNWLHHNPDPPPDVASDWVRRFNQNREEQGYHVFLNTYLSWGMVLRVLKRWLRLSYICWRLGDLEDPFRPQGSQLSLWPLMKEYWRESLQGSAAVSNLLTIELFDAALRDVPHQKLGLYLCENNEWERAFIHAWRKHGHGRLIGVPHSTPSFWGIRHLTDQRTLRPSGAYPMPQSDLMALNGKAALDEYLSTGGSEEAVVECEAQRFTWSHSVPLARPSHTSRGNNHRVLIIGDVMASFTALMLRMLEAAVSSIPLHAVFDVKPHPACPFRREDFPGVDLTMVSEPLSGILANYDVVYASMTTSGAVDAWLWGLPVIVMLDETQLNFSPLRGRAGVRFVGSPEELAEALGTRFQETVKRAPGDNYFFLDPELPRWQRILSASS